MAALGERFTRIGDVSFTTGVLGAATLGNYLRELRERQKVSQKEVAEETGISRPYLSQLETGKRGVPGPKILKRLADFYGVSVESLFAAAGLPTKALYATPQAALDTDERFRRMIMHPAMTGIFNRSDEDWIAREAKRRWLALVERLFEHYGHPEITFDDFLAETAMSERFGPDEEVEHGRE